MNETVLAEPRLYFWFADGRSARSIRQLVELVPTIPEHRFIAHVNDEKNDFYRWVADVFHDRTTADAIRSCRTQAEFTERMPGYLRDEERETEQRARRAERKAPERPAKRLDSTEPAVTVVATSSPVLSSSGHASFDEHSLERLAERLKELRHRISETRKAGKDPLLAELTLRTVQAKMGYARASERQEDAEKVAAILDEAERELGDAESATDVDVRAEVAALAGRGA